MDDPIRGLLVIGCLFIILALVSAAKSAFEQVNEGNVEKRAEEGDKKAIRLLRFFNDPQRYIDLMEIIIMIVSLFAGMVYAFSGYVYFEELFARQHFDWEGMPLVLMVIVSVLLCYIFVLFGFLYPKKLAKKHAQTYAYRLAGLILLIGYILGPFLWLLKKGSRFLLFLSGIHPSELEDNVTEEEIIKVLNEGQEQGVLEAEEAEMISNIIEFNEKEVKDIMTHRKNMVAIRSDMPLEEALRFILEENHSRYPIYTDAIDNIVGIVHLKDLMRYYVSPKENQTVFEVSRKPYFVPDTQNIDVLFRDMQLKKLQLVVAVDEYGQTAGLVAMEDILEEIVGDIQDEYDEEEIQILSLEEGVYLVQGTAELEELMDRIGLSVEEEDLENYDTLNGLLISLLDRIPSDGEKATIRYEGFLFQILDTKDKMIRSVRIEKLAEEKEVQEEIEVAVD